VSFPATGELPRGRRACSPTAGRWAPPRPAGELRSGAPKWDSFSDEFLTPFPVMWLGFCHWFRLVFECRGLGSEALLRYYVGAAGRRDSLWPWPRWCPAPFGSAPRLPSACSAPPIGCKCARHTTCFPSVWFALLVMSCSFVGNCGCSL
jgi:hypothetical protein